MIDRDRESGERRGLSVVGCIPGFYRAFPPIHAMLNASCHNLTTRAEMGSLVDGVSYDKCDIRSGRTEGKRRSKSPNCSDHLKD
jgi:hypothetical protein